MVTESVADVSAFPLVDCVLHEFCSHAGFFPVLDGNSRGNFGLMDQVAALHWIQENIQEFGGDPSNVSIMGHGFGAASVNLLMLSPMAKGKPRAGIAEWPFSLSLTLTDWE